MPLTLFCEGQEAYYVIESTIRVENFLNDDAELLHTGLNWNYFTQWQERKLPWVSDSTSGVLHLNTIGLSVYFMLHMAIEW